MNKKSGAAALAIALAIGMPSIGALHRAQVSRAPNHQGDRSDEKPPDRSSASPGPSHLPADGIKLQTRLVNVAVTVSDSGGRSINGLTRENFEIFDDGVKQEIS